MSVKSHARQGGLVQHQQAAECFNDSGCNEDKNISDVLDLSVSDPDVRFDCLPLLFLLNVTSIAKPNAKQHLVADLLGSNADIGLIVETWLTNKHDSSEMEIDGFSLFRRDRCGKRKGGGLCAYVRNAIKCSVISFSEIEIDLSIEIMCLLCKSEYSEYVIFLCYHPPKAAYHHSNFKAQLSNCIEYVNVNHRPNLVLVAGDFNSLDTDFLCVDHGLYQLVNEPTHLNHTIDKLFVSRSHVYHCHTIASVVKTKHRAVIAKPLHYGDSSFDTKKSTSNKQKCTVYDTRAHNIDRLRYFLGTYNWSSLYDITSLNELYDAFLSTLKSAIQRCVPSKTVTTRTNDPYYITPFVKSLLMKRNKLRRRGKKVEAEELAVRINELIARHQQAHLQDVSASNVAELWKHVRNANGRNNSNTIPGDLLSSPDVVNNFFARISTDDNYNVPVLPLSELNTSSNSIETIEPYYIEVMLRKIKRTSPGFDNIPAWLFKSCSYEVADIIAYIINKSLMQGDIPNCWRMAIVTPIKKIPAPKTLSDYRPISVTPILSRLTEKLVVNRWIRPALCDINLHDQFAFKQTGSTTCALTKIFDYVTNAFENGNNYVRCLMVDFSKAFDTVDHAIIIRKINNLNLPTCIKNWVVSFLRDRSQMVKLNGQLSAPTNINRGIIQGSALGPYLFLVMLSDLVPTDTDCVYVKYADDLSILVPEHSSTSIAREYDHTAEYADTNNLTVNVKKTKEQIYYKNTRRQDLILPSLPNIELVEKCKLLGVFIDSRLNFNEHVSQVLTVCSRRFYLLKLLHNQGLSLDALHTIYTSLIVNKIVYCISAWGGFIRMSDIDRINSLFRRAKRYGYTHTVYDFKGLLFHHDSTLFKKMHSPAHCLHSLLPPTKVLNRNLRDRPNNFEIPLVNSILYKNSFLIRCTRI